MWSKGIIIPIHKKRDERKGNNYRGITLVNAIGKKQKHE